MTLEYYQIIKSGNIIISLGQRTCSNRVLTIKSGNTIIAFPIGSLPYNQKVQFGQRTSTNYTKSVSDLNQPQLPDFNQPQKFDTLCNPNFSIHHIPMFTQIKEYKN